MKHLRKINETTIQDQDNLKKLFNSVNSKIKGLVVETSAYEGKITLNNNLLFTTSGSESFSVIYGYLSGMDTAIKLINK